MSKTSYVAAIVAIAWVAIIWRWSDNLKADAGLMIVGLFVTLFGVWFIHGTQKFAERNPAQALLEGSELPLRLVPDFPPRAESAVPSERDH